MWGGDIALHEVQEPIEGVSRQHGLADRRDGWHYPHQEKMRIQKTETENSWSAAK